MSKDERKVVGVWFSVDTYRRVMKVKARTGLTASTLINNLTEIHIDELEQLTAADVVKMRQEIADEMARKKASASPPVGGPQAEGRPPGTDNPEHEADRPAGEGQGESEELTGEEDGAQEGGQNPDEPTVGGEAQGQDPAGSDSQDGGQPPPAEGEAAKPQRKRGRPRKQK